MASIPGISTGISRRGFLRNLAVSTGAVTLASPVFASLPPRAPMAAPLKEISAVDPRAAFKELIMPFLTAPIKFTGDFTSEGGADQTTNIEIGGQKYSLDIYTGDNPDDPITSITATDADNETVFTLDLHLNRDLLGAVDFVEVSEEFTDTAPEILKAIPPEIFDDLTLDFFQGDDYPRTGLHEVIRNSAQALGEANREA